MIEFPSCVDLTLRQSMADVQAMQDISEFQRDEFRKRIPHALKPLLDAQIRVNVPEGVLAAQPEALAAIVQQVREQYVAIFGNCLIRTLKRHVRLIEDLRKLGITVPPPQE